MRYFFIKIIMVPAILSLTGGNVMGELAQSELVEIAEQAGGLFRQANELATSDPARAKDLYGQAILRYERIIREGQIANADLYYNIGNAYLLTGDIGRAILNYRRAQRFTDMNTELAGNLNRNLETALERRLDQVPIKTEKRILKTLFFWHYDFSLGTRFLLASVGWAIALTAGSVLFWRRRTGLVWLLVIGLVISLCWAGSVGLDLHRGHSYSYGVILAEQVTARQGDGDNYPNSFKEPLHSGTEFSLRERRGRWLRIELANGDRAWIPASSAELI